MIKHSPSSPFTLTYFSAITDPMHHILCTYNSSVYNKPVGGETPLGLGATVRGKELVSLHWVRVGVRPTLA